MEPLVPAEVDLRGLPYMPLDVNRLRDSQLAISASGDEFRAAVLLWCASWNQVPAASLPADDATLAAYAGYGRDVKGWRKVKDGAMRGFVHCSDGRWYHPVVAEKALEAWRERLDYRDKKGNEAERLQRYRDEHRQIRDRLREYGITAPWNAKIEDLRATLQEHELKHSVDEPATRTGALQERNGKRCSTEPETHTGALPATAKKGREGKGRYRRAKSSRGYKYPLVENSRFRRCRTGTRIMARSADRPARRNRSGGRCRRRQGAPAAAMPARSHPRPVRREAARAAAATAQPVGR